MSDQQDCKSESINLDVSDFFIKSFQLEQDVLAQKIQMSKETINHNTSKGDVVETYFIDLLRRYLPRRYQVDKGFVLDSNGNTSEQIDIIIYDNQYTPVMLQQADHKYVMAEAVYAVFEVKSAFEKGNVEKALKKAKSVRDLKRNDADTITIDGNKRKQYLPYIYSGLLAYADKTSKKEISQDVENDIKTGKIIDNNALDFCLVINKNFVEIDWECYPVLKSGQAVPFDEYKKYCNENINDRNANDSAFKSMDEFEQQDLKLNFEDGTNALGHFIISLQQKLAKLGTAPPVAWEKYRDKLFGKKKV